MKTKTLIRAALILCIAVCQLNLSSQAKLTLYRVQSESNNDISEAFSCGSHFTQVVLPVNEYSTTQWRIKNEGNAPLQLDSAPEITGLHSTSFEIIGSVSGPVAPGNFITFGIRFHYTDFTQKSAFLNISSNDPANPSCGLLLQGVVGNPSICYCFCNEEQELDENCPWESTGFKSGLSVTETGCEGADDNICKKNLSITTLCSCADLTTSGSTGLYADTLTISAGAERRIFITFNSTSAASSFLDKNGKSITAGTLLGQTDKNGTLKFPFFRKASTKVDIKVNGIAFVSPDSCPDINDCTEPSSDVNTTAISTIPTLSEWSIILLGLLLFITSAVSIKQGTEQIRL